MSSKVKSQAPGRFRALCGRARQCRLLLAIILLSALVPDSIFAQDAADSGSECQLKDLVAKLRVDGKLVGLGAMIMVDGQVVDSSVDGERKVGSGVPLAIGDRFHLGSITKSMTATMIGRLVDSGRMTFADTIAECFPGENIHEAWKAVTFRQLLTHTSGASANFPIMLSFSRPELGEQSTKAQRKQVLLLLAKQPEHAVGTEHVYSNLGYTIAGAMAEEVTGKHWEELIKDEVFQPLHLNTAGFGPPSSPDDSLPEPRGHTSLFGWKLAIEDTDDNTFIIGPAGIVHMSLNDLCVYATEHMRGELGEGKLLSDDIFRQLHLPALENYACGWALQEPSDEIPHQLYWHNGSNKMWYALVVFIPEIKTVVAVTSNEGNVPAAETAAWEIVSFAAGQQSDNGKPEAHPCVQPELGE